MSNVEVGTAYATILPSAKGFAKNLQKSIAKEFASSDLDKMISEALAGRPISVPVKPDLDPRDVPDKLPVRPGREPKLPVQLDPVTKAFQDSVRRELAGLSREVATIDVGADTDGLRTDVSAAITAIEASLSADIPTEPADRREYERKLRAQVDEVAATVRANVHTDVDVDTHIDRDRERIREAGDTVGKTLASGILSSLTSGLGAISGPAMFAGVIAAAAVAGPLAGAAIAGGVLAALGGGVIGLAFASLAKDPLMQRAASGLATTIQSTLAKAAGPLLGTEDKPGPILLAMEEITDLVVELGPSLQQMFASIGPYIPTLAAGVAEFIRAVMPGLMDAVKASGPVLEQIAFSLGPLGKALGDFLTVVAILSPAAVDALRVLVSIVTHAIDLVSGLLLLLGSAFGGMYEWYEQIKSATADFWSRITTIFTTGGASVKERIEALIGAALRLFHDLWDKIVSGARGAVSNVGTVISGIPGRIKSALGNTSTLLLQAGKNVVQGLIDGIQSRLGSLANVASSLAGTIRSYLPFSPAKTGPLSGSGNPYASGQTIVRMLASGVTSTLGTAEIAAHDLAATFALGSGSAVGVAAASAGSVPAPALVADWAPGATGDALLDALRELIRIRHAGSPQGALGSGRYAVA